MNQNGVIALVLVILAVLIGYFAFSSSPNKPEVVTYGTDPEPTDPDKASGEKSDPVTPKDPSPDQTGSTEFQTPTAPDVKVEPPQDVKPKKIRSKKISYKFIFKGNLPASLPPFELVLSNSSDDSQSVVVENPGEGLFEFNSKEKYTMVSAALPGYKEIKDQAITITSRRAEIELQFMKPVAITGQVINLEKDPIPGAVLYLKIGEFNKKVYADVHGEFHFKNIPLGLAEIEIKHPDYDSSKVSEDIPAEGLKDLKISLERDAFFKGLVLDHNGKPASKVAVSLKGIASNSNLSTQTEITGKFSFRRVKKGRYNFKLEGLKGSYQTKLEFKRNQTIEKTFQLKPPPIISGKVVDENDAPVSGLKLFTISDKKILKAVTDDKGKFNLAVDKGGKFRLLTSSSTSMAIVILAASMKKSQI